jgi:hypothetical protein
MASTNNSHEENLTRHIRLNPLITSSSLNSLITPTNTDLSRRHRTNNTSLRRRISNINLGANHLLISPTNSLLRRRVSYLKVTCHHPRPQDRRLSKEAIIASTLVLILVDLEGMHSSRGLRVGKGKGREEGRVRIRGRI